MNNPKTTGLIKMSELARLSGVSASTIKFYVKEGLVEIAYKTGPNMAYYRRDSIDRVKRIKMLQTEKFYPLAVIRRLIESGEIDFQELELLDVIHKTGRDSSTVRYSYSETIRLSGLTRSDTEALMAAGIVTPERTGNRLLFRESDVRMLQLVKVRQNAGIPLAQTVASFGVYTEMLKETAAKDIESLITDTFLSRAHDTHSIVRIIRTADETLNEFIMLKRYEYNSAVGSRRIADLGEFTERFAAYLARLEALLHDFDRKAEAEAVGAVLSGKKCGNLALDAAAQVVANGKSGLALLLSACTEANKRLLGAHIPGLVTGCVRFGWASLCPREFAPLDSQAEEENLFSAVGNEPLAAAVVSLIKPL